MEAKLGELKGFITLLEKNPAMLHQPELRFFKSYLERMGGKIPDPPKSKPATESKNRDKAAEGGEKKKNEEPLDFSKGGGKRKDEEPLDFTKPAKEDKEASDAEKSSEVSADELSSDKGESSDDPDKMVPEEEPMPAVAPDMEKELTDEDYDKLGELKMSANKAMRSGENDKALDLMTQALLVGEPSALLYARRAAVLLKMKRPMACIRDCTEALKLNPDSAKAYKIRGKAYRRLHKWEEANKDLAMGQRIDYDDDTQDVFTVVSAKWKVIRKKKLGRNSRNEDRERRRKIKRVTRARKQAQKEYEEQKRKDASEEKKRKKSKGMPDGMPGGMPGGMPAGFAEMMKDPALSNPKVLAALQDIMKNPANISKYQNDPDVMKVIQKMTKMSGGMGGGMGGMPGGMGGMPGGMGGFPGGMGGMGGMGGFPGGMGGMGGHGAQSGTGCNFAGADDID